MLSPLVRRYLRRSVCLFHWMISMRAKCWVKRNTCHSCSDWLRMPRQRMLIGSPRLCLFSNVAMQIVLPVLFLSFLSPDSPVFRSRLPMARCGEEIIILSVFVVKHCWLSLDEPEPSSAEKLRRLDHPPETLISIQIYICWCCTLVHDEYPYSILLTIAILWSRNKPHFQLIVSSEITTNDLRWNRTEEINGKEDQTSSHLCPLC